MLVICSAGPRGLCGDPRIFGDLSKVPQVFRNPGGSPALQNEIYRVDTSTFMGPKPLAVGAQRQFTEEARQSAVSLLLKRQRES